ncbi:mas-related G-protein coupled receptor member H-like [Rhinatrema bivittatum]|uniref:mas-related G-protein coupled receptor member H-like n=1 Tax=Rhinatrema bivittatum TaxID=194408 RepID=UPI00112B3A9D|nr:mas-related G-protein coupled receptor member H-like [Rhinatrema bivittatum]
MTELSTVSLSTTGITEYDGTGESRSGEEMLSFSLYCLSYIISFLGLIGNGIVLWFLGFKMKRNKFTVYILNLAMADFFHIFCFSILALFSLFLPESFHFLYYPVMILSFGYFFMYNTGLFLLTAISLERCLSALYPLWYRCRRPKHQSTIVCVLLWVLSFLLTGIERYLCDFLNNFKNCTYTMMVHIGVFTFLFLTPVMVFSSLILFIKIQRRSQHGHSPKLYKVIVITVLIFLICALPLKVMLVTSLYLYHTIPITVLHLSFLLSVINSTANPCIYFLVGSRSRQRSWRSIKVALQRVFKQEMEEEMTTTSSRAETQV